MIIKAARPDIKDNSIKQYMSSLRTLNALAAFNGESSNGRCTGLSKVVASWSVFVPPGL